MVMNSAVTCDFESSILGVYGGIMLLLLGLGWEHTQDSEYNTR